jgi:hypothetical protein
MTEKELDRLTYEREQRDKAKAAMHSLHEAMPYIVDFTTWELCQKVTIALRKIAFPKK